MKILDTKIPEVKIIEPDVFGDHRGWFMETWSLPKYEALHFNSMQDNESFTAKRGTLRGIHFQQDPMAQAKIVRVVRGAVMDVAVDLRKGSPTYLQWVSVELSAENKRQFYIPRGFGHGFVTLTDDVDFCYKADNLYDHPSDRSIRFDDPAIGVDWGVTDPILSDKDKKEIIKQAIQRSEQVNIYENSEDNKSAIEGRIDTIDRIIMKLYNDYAAGTISEDVLNATASKMSDEVAKLKKQLSEIERKQSNGNEITNNYEKFFALVKQYEHIDELTEEIVRTFIERIEIEEKVLPENKKIAGKNVPYKQKITIYYRFIGNFQENIVNRQDIAS